MRQAPESHVAGYSRCEWMQTCAKRMGSISRPQSGHGKRRGPGDISLCVSPARRRFPVSETGLHNRPGKPISKHRLSHGYTRCVSRHGAVWFLDHTDGGRGSRPRRVAKHLACYHVRACVLSLKSGRDVQVRLWCLDVGRWSVRWKRRVSSPEYISVSRWTHAHRRVRAAVLAHVRRRCSSCMCGPCLRHPLSLRHSAGCWPSM